MKTKKGPGAYPIPFHKGGLCHYPGWPEEPTEWRDNYTFVAEIVFQGFRRGRSAAYAEFKDAATGQKYPMFLTHLDDVLRGYSMRKGKVRATWTFCKCGKNYGICLAPEQPK